MIVRILALTSALAIACDARAPSDSPDAASPIDATSGGAACPMPLRSRDRAPVASHGDAAGLVDGALAGATWTGAVDAWVAIDVGVGPTAVMSAWTAIGDGQLTGYAIETSADSTDGKDGHWQTAVAILDNTAATRADAIAFTGQRWLRLRITEGAADLSELAVHDASHGTCDSWLFIGDSITAMAFNLSTDFADDVHAARPDTYPLRLGIGVGGTNSENGLANLDAWLAAYPDVHNWVVSYGTNDMGGGDPVYAPAYHDRMRRLITRLQQAGKRVFVPRIPYGTWDPDGAVIPVYNAEVDRVVAETGAIAGPDLYAYFRAHPDQLADQIHPGALGARAMNELWSAIALAHYP
ncbi:MAG: hypothetical protein K8W52_39110 [Deltaproteobacteria bacterium]|nr:hypothetical protein [Deltaproteobacteria bacterium]